MMQIPCPTCERPTECTRDRRCNRPRDLEHARRELEAAALARDAAEKRWQAALLSFADAVCGAKP